MSLHCVLLLAVSHSDTERGTWTLLVSYNAWESQEQEVTRELNGKGRDKTAGPGPPLTTLGEHYSIITFK